MAVLSSHLSQLNTPGDLCLSDSSCRLILTKYSTLPGKLGSFFCWACTNNLSKLNYLKLMIESYELEFTAKNMPYYPPPPPQWRVRLKWSEDGHNVLWQNWFEYISCGICFQRRTCEFSHLHLLNASLHVKDVYSRHWIHRQWKKGAETKVHAPALKIFTPPSAHHTTFPHKGKRFHSQCLDKMAIGLVSHVSHWTLYAAWEGHLGMLDYT